MTFEATAMAKTTTTRYDVADHLRTPEEMAAYLEACLEEADGDAAFIAKALGDIACAHHQHRRSRARNAACRPSDACAALVSYILNSPGAKYRTKKANFWALE